MPVGLNEIPEKLPLPEPPDKVKWMALSIAVALLISGCLLLLWPGGTPTHNGWFWFVIIIIPLLFSSFCYACRLRYFENRRDRIVWWNQLHQKEYDDRVVRGRRAAVVLGMAYITPGPCNKLADFLLKGNGLLQSFFSLECESTVTCARFDNNSTFINEKEYQQRLESSLQSIIKLLASELSNVSGPLEVFLKHDGMLDDAEVLSVWHQVFPQTHVVSIINVLVKNDGLMWLDNLLDKTEGEVILSVEINLFLSERDREAESVSAVLVASPEWHKKMALNILLRYTGQ